MIENHIDLVKSVFREEIPDEYTFKSELSGIVHTGCGSFCRAVTLY